ncbi:hypothetical protein [Janibacter anophelis]|uniref:endonuclease toxin domain-containing protein n=1 Tax=Janibacter anophelis TaxID=319054 RepID=UPI0012EDA571|nr:hypothetical protein [Janibacter anophelis]
MAEDLSVSANQSLQVEQSGTVSMGVLLEAWAGPDTEGFAGDWQSAGPLLTTAAERLSLLARLLIEQAEQQDRASGCSGVRGGAPGPGTGPGRPLFGIDLPDSVAGPFDVRNVMGGDWSDVRAGLKVPGLAGLTSPINNPIVSGPLNYYRRIYEDWQASGLTWFEAMFVPWPMPDKFRNKYLELVDQGTDWANDVYKDHVRDLPGIAHNRWALHRANDAVEYVDMFVSPLDRALGPTVPGTAWNVVKGTVNDTTEMADDPKGWWGGASGLDQAGAASTLIPAGGFAAKGATKALRELIDVFTGAKRARVVTRTWDDDLADLNKATDLKDSDDPFEKAYALNAERAQQRIAKNDIQTPDDVWNAGNEPRGLIIEALNKGNLPPGFQTIDRVETVDGVDRAVSTKTLDPSLPTYDGKPKAIESKLNDYLDQLDRFEEGEKLSKANGNFVEVTEDHYEKKVLEVFLRPGTMSKADWEAVARVRARADEKKIALEVHEYP